MTVVSILLPTHNGSATIKRAVESVLSQTYTNWELLILDDGSTDNTHSLVQDYVRKDTRIHCVQNTTNVRLPKTLNSGLSKACGTYIARIDDDDIWTDPHKLAKQVEFLTSNTDHVLVGTWFNKVTEDGTCIESAQPPTTNTDIRKVILSRNTFGHSTVLFSKEAARICGGYDESLSYTEDYDLWLKLGRIGKLANLNQITTAYLVRPQGMSHKTSNLSLLRYHFRLIRVYGSDYPRKYMAYIKMLVNYILY